MNIHHYVVAAVSLLVPIVVILQSLTTNTGPTPSSGQKPGHAGAAGASDEEMKSIAQLWLGAVLHKAGDPSGERLIEEARHSGPEAEKQYMVLKQIMKF